MFYRCTSYDEITFKTLLKTEISSRFCFLKQYEAVPLTLQMNMLYCSNWSR